MRGSFWPIYGKYGSLCKRPRNLLPQRPETSSSGAFPRRGNKFIDSVGWWATMTMPPGLPPWGFECSTNPSAAPLGLMLLHCLPWVWFCAPRHLERPPRHRPLWPSRTSLPELWSIGFYGPQVLGGPALMTASRGSPYFQPPTNWITYFQSPFNPSNWGRNSHLIDDFTNNIAGGKSLRESKCRMLSTLSALFLQLHQSLYKADGCCTEIWTLMIRKRWKSIWKRDQQWRETKKQW